MQRPPLRVPLMADKMPPLCVQCKYYMPPRDTTSHLDKKQGLCKKSGKIHVVDGEVTFENVVLVREYDCKGLWYEDAK
jgi:hypothetical protein